MSGWVVAGVALGGATGAVVRDLLARSGAATTRIAWCNMAGAFLLGLAAPLLSPAALDVVGGGLLGGLTTFSTWAVQIDEAGDAASRATLLLVPLALGVAAAALGLALGALLAA